MMRLSTFEFYTLSENLLCPNIYLEKLVYLLELLIGKFWTLASLGHLSFTLKS